MYFFIDVEGLASRLAGCTLYTGLYTLKKNALFGLLIRISHCTCYCWKERGHLCDGAGPSTILFVCPFADPTLLTLPLCKYT